MGLCAGLALCLAAMPAQAATVTQLNITSESVSLNFGPQLGTLAGTFNQPGQLIMGQFQPTPNIFSPVQLDSHLTFSIFSSSGQPVLNLLPPSGTTTGSTMTVDVSSLFAGLSSTQWGSWMTPATFGSLNIGGIATGSFNQATNAFNISWTHAFTGIPFLTSGTFSLQGTALVAAVPLPAAALLFGSGLLGLAGALRKKFNLA
ncbi:MAG: hypothetical protein JW395_1664 [Nitrospira sp.]|nr:hypothetical protein [Nitrospira sp.]